MMVFAPYTLFFDAISHILSVGTITCYVSLEGITRLQIEKRKRKKKLIYITIVNLLILTDTAKFAH